MVDNGRIIILKKLCLPLILIFLINIIGCAPGNTANYGNMVKVWFFIIAVGVL